MVKQVSAAEAQEGGVLLQQQYLNFIAKLCNPEITSVTSRSTRNDIPLTSAGVGAGMLPIISSMSCWQSPILTRDMSLSREADRSSEPWLAAGKEE